MTEQEARRLKIGDVVHYSDGINEPEPHTVVDVRRDGVGFRFNHHNYFVEFTDSSELGSYSLAHATPVSMSHNADTIMKQAIQWVERARTRLCEFRNESHPPSISDMRTRARLMTDLERACAQEEYLIEKHGMDVWEHAYNLIQCEIEDKRMHLA